MDIVPKVTCTEHVLVLQDLGCTEGDRAPNGNIRMYYVSLLNVSFTEGDLLRITLSHLRIAWTPLTRLSPACDCRMFTLQLHLSHEIYLVGCNIVCCHRWCKTWYLQLYWDEEHWFYAFNTAGLSDDVYNTASRLCNWMLESREGSFVCPMFRSTWTLYTVSSSWLAHTHSVYFVITWCVRNEWLLS